MEAYSRGQRLTNRIYQLEQDLGWTKDDTTVAFSVLDDRLPSGLHSDGTSMSPLRFLSYQSMHF